jgi:hypothetical protein
MKRLVIFCLVLAAAAYAQAPDSAANGFTVKQSYDVAAAPADAYKKFLAVGEWWDSAHTFSQDAHNLSIEEKAQGCWCEKLPGGGGVRHMELINFAPGKILRFSGGLGPLQGMAAAATLTVTFTAKEGGTRVDMTYAVLGYAGSGITALEPAVQGVFAGAFGRFKNYAEHGNPAPKK